MRFEIPIGAFQQRILALTLVTVPLLAVGAILVSFLSAQITHHAHVSLLVRKLARERALLEEAPNWAARLTTIKTSSLWQGIFLANTISSSGIPGQHDQLLQIVKKSGATVLRDSTNLSNPSQGRAVEIDETLIFSADITMLTHILYELRAPGPLFVIRKIAIHNEEGTLTAPRTVPNQLRVDLTVAGFARPS